LFSGRVIINLNKIMENKSEAIKGQNLILKYKVREPLADIKNPGLIVLLHGVGSNEDDLFRIAGNFSSECAVVAARAPYTISDGRYAWFGLSYSDGKPVINPEQAEKSRVVLNTFINQLIERYHIDTSKVFLGGFSQGGIMSYSVGLTFPQKFAGIFILSSRLLPEVKPLIRETKELSQLNIFIAHGIADPVLPLSYAHEARAYLQHLTSKITCHEYEMGHSIGDAELSDLKNWLLERY
jgi:phospholipase/carboxylesterase